MSTTAPLQNATLGAPVELDQRKIRTLWQNAFRHIVRDRLTMAALTVLVVLTLICFLAPPVVENVLGVDVNRTKVLDKFRLPGDGYALGTDHLGRDQLIRLLYGGRISLSIAYAASLMTIVIATSIGIVAGFFGGKVDDIIIWFINTLTSIPSIFLLLIASTIWSPSPEVLIVLLALLGWMGTCRLVRGEVITIKEREYIQAAHAVGAPAWRIMWNHIFPNVLSIVIISLAIDAGVLILVESGLSFLGLGVQPPTPTWGNMLTNSRSYFVTGPHLVVLPGLLITITVLCFYLIGDGFRDALDPRSHH
ncbi:MAG: ABC transporter permease [Anaerolineae bacterium]|nr:ABC transporter permease [Anaerolineae bacterium]